MEDKRVAIEFLFKTKAVCVESSIPGRAEALSLALALSDRSVKKDGSSLPDRCALVSASGKAGRSSLFALYSVCLFSFDYPPICRF